MQASLKPEPVELTEVELTNRLDQALLQPSTELFTLGPGDKLDIELLGEATSKVTTVVAPDGSSVRAEYLPVGYGNGEMFLGPAKLGPAPKIPWE